MASQKYLLGVNAGSSSVKLSLYTIATQGSTRRPTQILEAELAKLTSPPHTLTIQPVGFESSDKHYVKKQEISEELDGQGDAFDFLLKCIYETPLNDGQTISASDISHVLHRIVHGGHFTAPQRLDKKTVNILTDLSDLAPLHNAASLPLVHASFAHFPDSTENIAFFDTSFHSTLPEQVKTYMLDPHLTKNNMIRKYGFHGLSYASILRAVAGYLGQPPQKTSLLALHLGSGCSACAIQNGRSINTTMGLTPLEGLPGATRSGTVDPSAVFHMLAEEEAGRISYRALRDVGISRAEEVLNKKSGWKSITGTSDFGEVCSRMEAGDQACRIAFEILIDRIVRELGAYYVALGGEVDALVFAGGIGEKSALLRREVVRKLECLGFGVDEERNEKVDLEEKVVDITVGDCKMNKVLVVRTDETGQMAEECCGNEEFW